MAGEACVKQRTLGRMRLSAEGFLRLGIVGKWRDKRANSRLQRPSDDSVSRHSFVAQRQSSMITSLHLLFWTEMLQCSLGD